MTYRTAAGQAITKQADSEAAANPLPDPAKVPDLLKPGPYQFTRRQLELQRSQPAPNGTTVTLRYGVDLVVPQNTPKAAPVVIISHGLGSSPAGFMYLAEHLASYGFTVALPEHVTSGEAIKEKFKAGVVSTNVTPSSFLDRPLDVTQTLDELERLSQQDPALAGKLDMQRVGILGHSFGGYTAFVSGGGKFNWEQVQTTCQADNLYLNLSLFLQCVADKLPRTDGQLADRRIRAIFSINPVTSAVVGQAGMEQIQVPTLVVASSADILASPLAEQMGPFLSLKTPDKYLVLAVAAGHTAPDTGGAPVNTMPSENTLSQLLSGEDPPLMRQYMQMLSLAFMQAYVGDRPEYKQLLSAAYARSITKEPLRLELIRSLTAKQIQESYETPGTSLP
jgi:predicted dienelactone hydrolase